MKNNIHSGVEKRRYIHINRTSRKIHMRKYTVHNEKRCEYATIEEVEKMKGGLFNL